MSDLLVKLYELPDPSIQLERLKQKKIYLQRAMAAEKNLVVAWVRRNFGDGWSAECDISFSRQPIACMIAVNEGSLVGFACYDCTYGNFFGPIGIDSNFRKKGIGRALLLITLNAMSHAGYAYAVIGGAGPTDFFKSCAGAFPIPGSTPGIYRPVQNQIVRSNDNACSCMKDR